MFFRRAALLYFYYVQRRSLPQKVGLDENYRYFFLAFLDETSDIDYLVLLRRNVPILPPYANAQLFVETAVFSECVHWVI